MQAPAFPTNEDERQDALRALYILDTEPEERFDRLTRMAKRLFNVPIAVVSLIDQNRQWFKSSVGLDVCETARDISFCGHAILNNGVFIIENAAEDERFKDNPLVTGAPHIRFYAGFPILSPKGLALGTFCIIDSSPRHMSEEDLLVLNDLASLAKDELTSAQLAATDELTGILNRRGLMLLGKHCLDLFRRENIVASMAFIDMDGFKEINDKFGHAEGDHVLAQFGELLSSSFRRSDVVARQSGDEFVVLLANADKQQATEVFERFHACADSELSSLELGYKVQFSFGVVQFCPDRHKKLDDLIAEGDLEMYRTKRRKKAKVT